MPIKPKYFMLALIPIIWQVLDKLDFGLSDIIHTVRNSEHSRIFVFNDWHSRMLILH